MKLLSIILALCLILTGCAGLTDGSYAWEESHPVEIPPVGSQQVSAKNYAQLRDALVQLIQAGAEQGTVYVEDYIPARLDADVKKAVEDVGHNDPIAAYAVEQILCDLGTSGSRPALAVKISYIHDRTEIRRIRNVADNEAARAAIGDALTAFDTGLVLQVESYTDADFLQMAEDFALANPQFVMEQPQVTVALYPETGKTRVVEMKFMYQTSRDSLKTMQSYVKTLFSSAMGYVSGDDGQAERFGQLYGFLMNRFEYKLETSITPSYHLLRHGIGDSKAFASVYAAMCRQAGLDCRMVSGTRAGERWYWNIIRVDGAYYHVDLLASKTAGDFSMLIDEQMQGYVWDFDAYPACVPPEPVPEEPENP